MDAIMIGATGSGREMGASATTSSLFRPRFIIALWFVVMLTQMLSYAAEPEPDRRPRVPGDPAPARMPPQAAAPATPSPRLCQKGAFMRKAIYLALRRSCMCAAVRTPVDYPGLEGVEVSYDPAEGMARMYVNLPTGAVSEFDLAGETDKEVAEYAEKILGLG
jgi:hypothetical protein